MTEQEQWRDIPGYEGLYRVSDLGQVKSLERIVASPLSPRSNTVRQMPVPKRIKKPRLHSSDYLCLCLYKHGKRETYLVHRLVAIAFLGPPQKGQQVNHKNSQKTDNRAPNLEWVSPGENLLHDRQMTGNRRSARLTRTQVLQIRHLWTYKGYSVPELCRLFSKASNTIRDIVNHRSWLNL